LLQINAASISLQKILSSKPYKRARNYYKQTNKYNLRHFSHASF